MATSGPKLRTVVIDDSADLRELLAVALEERHFTMVGHAGTAAAGTALAAEQHPDLVLLDVAMPGTSGLAALPALREAAPDASVVVMSGYPRADLERPVLALGAAGYVEKGMSIRRFVDRVVAAAGVLELVTSVLAEDRVELERDTRSGSSARRFVTAALERWGCEEAMDVVQLLVSELVTNAVVHAKARPNVAVIVRSDAVRIEVADDDTLPLAPRAADDEAESGRGLLLLDRLAKRWGVEPTADGKTVWFEVDRFDT